MSESSLSDVLPSLDSVVSLYRSQEKVRQFARHNLTIWRDITGASKLASEYRLDFDPRADEGSPGRVRSPGKVRSLLLVCPDEMLSWSIG